jgi:hypothetical protein
MDNEIKFKSKISLLYILSILGIFLVITQINTFIRGDYFNKTAWLIYCILIIYVFIFNLFFSWSFEITSIYFKVKFSPFLFFLKAKLYKISDIDYIKIIYLRGKGVLPYISIKLLNRETIIKHYYFLISKKSIKEMFCTLKDLDINVTIVETVKDLKS